MPVWAEIAGRFGLALLLTVAVEGGVAWVFGFRAAWAQLAIGMVNCITNPALNFIRLALAWQGVSVTLPLALVLESLVVVIEWRLLVHIFAPGGRRLFYFSCAANASSFLAGWLLFGL